MLNNISLITLLAFSLSFAGDLTYKPKLITSDDLSRKGKILYQIGKIETAIGTIAPLLIIFDALNKEWKPYHVGGLIGCAGFVTLGQIHIELGKKTKIKID